MTPTFPDRAIHLREEGGGHLQEADAALVSGGDETGQIADDAPAEGDDDGFAIDLALDEIPIQAAGGLQALIAFAIGHQQGMIGQPGMLQTGAQRIAIVAIDHAIADDHHRTDGIGQTGERGAEPVMTSFRDMHIIGSVAEIHANAAQPIENPLRHFRGCEIGGIQLRISLRVSRLATFQ